MLDVDGAVTRVRGGWVATGQPWAYDAERYGRVAESRRREQGLMREYQSGDGCRMAFLQRVLDDPSPEPCGRCDRCAGPWYQPGVGEAAVSTARLDLDRVGVELAPRHLWPSGMTRLGVPVAGRIAAGHAAAPGRVLARFTDLGLGQRLRDLLAGPDAPVSEELLDACFRVLREWPWEQRPAAVVSVPALRRPLLVGSVATELARRGRLADLGSLGFDHGAPPVEPAGNSAYRLRQVWGRFGLTETQRQWLAEAPGPVLLVDDLVDSRWTMTVAARLLRDGGAPAVLPFALAAVG